ncbi:LCP family protein [Virgibacillus halophilus]|uniref:LCP family protein n=1 Tax=Tigheibacillus halophilus TaxID=361280 RepID=A0ABU5C492_9BACI|nr:LCP family protein [Virgibacillus halophilus]
MSKNNTPRQPHTRRVRKRKLRKRVFFILVPLLVFVAAFSYATYLYIKADSVFSESYVDDGRKKSDLRDKEVDPDFDNVSILIMGIDESEKRNNAKDARTDSMMVATLNKDDKSVKLLSIPRDSYVYIPEVGYETKINHAHKFGGPKAAMETTENLLHIPIDYYVTINFEAFLEVVDAIDGVEVDVPYEMKEQDSKDKADAIHLKPGKQTLNGEEALAFARTRHYDNDIERGKRQQEILKAVMSKSASLKSVLKFDNIIEAVGKNMKTNMTFSEMKSFISYGTSGKKLSIDTNSLAGEDWWTYNSAGSRVYYFKLDDLKLEETRKELQKHLEINPDTSKFNDGPQTNDGTEDGTDNGQGENGQDPNNSQDQNQYDGQDQNQYNDQNQNDGQYDDGSQTDDGQY